MVIIGGQENWDRNPASGQRGWGANRSWGTTVSGGGQSVSTSDSVGSPSRSEQGVTGMALLVAFQEKLVYVPVLPGLTKAYPITLPAGTELHGGWGAKALPEKLGLKNIYYVCNIKNMITDLSGWLV